MSNRKIIAVGYTKGELLPPYGVSDERDGIVYARGIHKREAKIVLDHLKGKDVIRSVGSINFQNSGEIFNGHFPREVEIVGSWLEDCVKKTTLFFVTQGSKVLLNPEFLISNYPRNREQREEYIRTEFFKNDFSKSILKTPNGIICSNYYFFSPVNVFIWFRIKIVHAYPHNG